ncbi:MAG TPA: hydrogenase maturation nickel metallochaperone HypA [Anaerolineales bacterium]|nr:hydrogenase maturation nickel metallochaperone HypA [Anaerolineales bacterium]
MREKTGENPYIGVVMREYQSTQNILKKLLLQLKDARGIKNVHLVMGEISELDRGLILEHWRELSKKTPAEHAQLHFRLSKAEVQCMACFNTYQPLDGRIHCPYCGSYGAKILSGEEFELESFELEDEHQ